MLKTLIRIDGRHVGVFIVGTVVGALGGYLATHGLYYAQTDWAAVWTMRWNAVLAIIAFVALVAAYLAAAYAKQNVSFFREVERLKRTEEQMAQFQGALQSAYNAQVVSAEGMAKRQEVNAAYATTVNPNRDQMLELINHLSGLVSLSDIDMLDEGFYFDRHGIATVMTYVALKPMLNVMKESGLFDYADVRSFAVRAYKHVTRDDFKFVLLQDIRPSTGGDDLVAVRLP